jgi:hypothetical protein
MLPPPEVGELRRQLHRARARFGCGGFGGGGGGGGGGSLGEAAEAALASLRQRLVVAEAGAEAAQVAAAEMGARRRRLAALRAQLARAKGERDFARCAQLRARIEGEESEAEAGAGALERGREAVAAAEARRAAAEAAAVPLRAALVSRLEAAVAAERFGECVGLQHRIDALDADPTAAVGGAAAAAEAEAALAALAALDAELSEALQQAAWVAEAAEARRAARAVIRFAPGAAQYQELVQAGAALRVRTAASLGASEGGGITEDEWEEPLGAGKAAAPKAARDATATEEGRAARKAGKRASAGGALLLLLPSPPPLLVAFDAALRALLALCPHQEAGEGAWRLSVREGGRRLVMGGPGGGPGGGGGGGGGGHSYAHATTPALREGQGATAVELQIAAGSTVANLFVGLVPAGKALPDGELYNDRDVWLIDCRTGALYGGGGGGSEAGRGTGGAGELGAGCCLTLRHDGAAGTLHFLKDGELHGPGFGTGVFGPMKVVVSMMTEGNEVRLLA